MIRIKKKCQSYRTRFSRRLKLESLENRRLLIAEGDLFTVSGLFDTSGLLGNISAELRWGDGTTSAAKSVTGGNQTGNLKIKFDYTLDTSGFFSGVNETRRNTLQLAADSLTSRFSDQLAAITPSNSITYKPQVIHPSKDTNNDTIGDIVDVPVRSVAANEIIVFVGARDLSGNQVGSAGAFRAAFDPSPSCQRLPSAECQAELDKFRDASYGRGQAGALTKTQSDVAPSIGSISFDSLTKWHSGTDTNIASDEQDFFSVAVHEVAHILGFGDTFNANTAAGEVTPWGNLSKSGKFTGAKATETYTPNGSPDVVSNHWADTVPDPTVMKGSILKGNRFLFSPLDFAVMDDIGWDVGPSKATVTGEHRFVDNGSFDVEVVLRGAKAGELVFPVPRANITNAVPTLTVPETKTIEAGKTLSITDIGIITDAGSRNTSSTEPTSETFQYTIDWSDGSPLDSGDATIDAHGDRNGAQTKASFNGSHTFATAGTRKVKITVTDDDRGSVSKTFDVVVNEVVVPKIEVVISPTGVGGRTDPVDRESGPQPTSFAKQRSELREIVVNLVSSISSAKASGIVLTNLGINPNTDADQVVPLEDAQVKLSSDGKQLRILLDTLDDGIYKLDLLREITGGETLTIRGDATNKLFVLKADWNGSGGVNIQDFATFAYWFGMDTKNAPDYVDSNRSGGINIQDFSVYAKNFGKSINLSGATSELISEKEQMRFIEEAQSEWQPALRSLVNPTDVNGDGSVTANDALRVINRINVVGHQTLEGWDPTDVTRDGVVTPMDALRVINRLKVDLATSSQIAAKLNETDSSENSQVVDEMAINRTSADSVKLTSSSADLNFFDTALVEIVNEKDCNHIETDNEYNENIFALLSS